MSNDYKRYLETGKIFRDGKLVDKEEWYKAHPTKEMKAHTQAKVNDAIATEMALKFRKPDEGEREAAGAPPFDYLCTKCNRKHKFGSKIHEQHQDFAQET